MQDPTGIFLSVVRSTHPEALAQLARICQQQSQKQPEIEPETKAEHDEGRVLQAMELLKTGRSSNFELEETSAASKGVGGYEKPPDYESLPSGFRPSSIPLAQPSQLVGPKTVEDSFLDDSTIEIRALKPNNEPEAIELDEADVDVSVQPLHPFVQEEEDEVEPIELPAPQEDEDESLELEASAAETEIEIIELHAHDVGDEFKPIGPSSPEGDDDVDSVELCALVVEEEQGSVLAKDTTESIHAGELAQEGISQLDAEESSREPDLNHTLDTDSDVEEESEIFSDAKLLERELPADEQPQLSEQEASPESKSVPREGEGLETQDDSIAESDLEEEGEFESESESGLEKESQVEAEIEAEVKSAVEVAVEPDAQSISDDEPRDDSESLEDFSPTSDVEVSANVSGVHAELEESESIAASVSDQLAAPARKGPSEKAPLRIEAAPSKSALPQINGEAIEAIPGAFDKGINKEFKGVYEKATQRGGVFDAQRRDAFSSESEKKVKSSYLGLKAITFDEALTVQQPEVNPAIMRSQSQNVIAPEAPHTFADKATAVWAIVDRMHSTPVIVTTSVMCLAFLGFFVGNLCRAEGMMQDGEKLFAAGKYPEAIKVLTTSAELNPMRARTLFIRGRAYNKIGEPGKAVEDFSRSVTINPRTEEPFDHRASTYIKAGKFEKALADYKRIFELVPNDATLYRYNNAAFAARQCGKFEEASKYYDRALQIAPDDNNALLGKVMCEVGLSRYGKAIEQCELLIAKKPNDLEAYVTRGWCYTLLKRNDAALSDFNFVLKRDPKNIKALLNRGVLSFNMGNSEAAVKDYDAAIAADPTYLEARTARAWANINRNPQVALSDFRIVTRSPEYSVSAKFWKVRAELEAKLGEYKEASNSYRKAIKFASAAEPGMLSSLYVGQASVLASLRQYDNAIASSNEALKLEPRNYLALTYRGLAHDNNGNGISAVADYSSAISIAPAAADALWYRAQHYSKTHEYHSAQKDLKDYLNVRPGDKSAQKMLASISSKTQHATVAPETGLEKRSRKYRAVPFDQLVTSGLKELNSGHTETAAEMLQEAVRKNPSDVTARRYLCHALVREDPKASVVQFDVLRSAITLPADDERSYRHALSLAATGSLVESAAIDKALKTVSEEPGNTQACYKLSTLYAAAGILSKAAKYCQAGMASAKNPAETKRFQDLYQRLNKQNVEGEHKEDIEG